MSREATAWVWRHSEATGEARLVLLALADHADERTTQVFTGAHRIAAAARVNTGGLAGILDLLTESGDLTGYHLDWTNDSLAARFTVTAFPQVGAVRP